VNNYNEGPQLPMVLGHASNILLTHVGEFGVRVYDGIIWMRVMVKQRKIKEGSFVSMEDTIVEAVNARRHRVRSNRYENVIISAIRIWFANYLFGSDEDVRDDIRHDSIPGLYNELWLL
jgi:hypothetical protein